MEALLYADALYKKGKPRTEYFPAMAQAAVAMGPVWNKTEVPDSSTINNRELMLNWFNREMNSYNKSALGSSDPGSKHRMLAARGLWAVDSKPLAKDYALYAAQGGASNKADGFWYLDEVAGNEPTHVDAALQILERVVYELTESEMQRLLPPPNNTTATNWRKASAAVAENRQPAPPFHHIVGSRGRTHRSAGRPRTRIAQLAHGTRLARVPF